MDIKFDKKNSNEEQQSENQRDKRRQSTLLVLLLLLLGVVGYLYFFTGLIRPVEPPPKPATPSKVVKKPLPARDTDLTGKDSNMQGDTAVKPVADEGKDAKPAQQAADAGKKDAKGKARQPATKEKEIATATTEKQAVAAAPSVTSKPPAPAKAVVTKNGVTAQKPPKQIASAVTANRNGPWLLVAGLYVFENKLAEDMAKLKNAGFNPVVSAGAKQSVIMYRLLFGSYMSRAEALQAIKSLHPVTGDAFMLASGGIFKVFAGSFAHEAGALAEQQNLASFGVKTVVHKTEVPVSAKKLVLGAFAEKAAAEAALKKVKSITSGTPFLE